MGPGGGGTIAPMWGGGAINTEAFTGGSDPRGAGQVTSLRGWHGPGYECMTFVHGLPVRPHGWLGGNGSNLGGANPP